MTRWTLTPSFLNPHGDCVAAIERCIVFPGQSTAYLIGMLEIYRLREYAREQLGEDFDLRDFHDVVLANGAAPLEVLAELIDSWIADRQAE